MVTPVNRFAQQTTEEQFHHHHLLRQIAICQLIYNSVFLVGVLMAWGGCLIKDNHIFTAGVGVVLVNSVSRLILPPRLIIR